MTMTEQQDPTQDAPADPDPAPTMLDQLGGPMGFVWSTVPVVVFVTANALLPLPATIAVALGVGLALTVFRLVRRERFSSATGSLLGVAVAVGVVAWTGSARDFFVIGIWAALAGFVVTAGSLLARRPITGVVWNLVHGRAHDWRADRVVLRAHDLATLAAAAVFGARFVVQQWLYLADTTDGLGIARIAMGTPLTVLAALVVVWAFRRSTARLAPRS
ncbi:DUF3159 domain-containing protein [Actinomycetospora endophytica]|uniref:DUF3159 domain-containing protein n=1 Tax=Actinomycetospora endophytica TaxID=2291215 RepID=A0ABS8PIN7_9PSEU|nr:DUF3159 domain-containing protein [Actinomycetospora endophytica]MCD2198152.1 DUF3159 domain-containing protein [Actinomycetospora endophytica]